MVMRLVRFCLFLVFFAFTTLLTAQKVALFNDTSAWYHWGCTATSTGLKEGIRHLGYELDTIPINVTYSLKEVPAFDDFDDVQKFQRFCNLNKDTIAFIQAADAVVVSGEGTHDLRDAPRALLYIAYISKKNSQNMWR